MLLGLAGMVVVLIPGCRPVHHCGKFIMDVSVSSSEPLLLGDVGGDTALDPPTLVGEILPGGDWIEEQQLVPCEGSGFCLGDRFSLRGQWPDADTTVEASDFTLSFDLVWQEDGDTGDDGFPPFTQQGGPSEVTLWNGWTLNIDWGEPWNGCK
jgi:hypothetical protein